jgi:riboflavin biosynthesis pyrimidine reductase
VLMRQLLPAATDDVDTLDAYALEGGDRPHLRVNMVASVDGAAAVDGRVGVLSGGADQVLLHDLRTLCDVLLVGAGTVRAEGYGPLTLSEEQQQRRTGAGQDALPRLAILTRSIDLDLAAPVFTAATLRPLVVTSRRASAARRAEAEQVADVLVAGDEEVDLRAAFVALASRGLSRILSEGGPHVLAALFAADLVDELCLAVAPLVTCGAGPRITSGTALVEPAGLRLAHLLERDQYLFLRYLRDDGR